MMMEHAIDVENLNIKYKSIQSYSLKQSLLKMRTVQSRTVHAVKDVTFSVNKGEVVGIVGKNGSGKSTMLTAIAGIFSPDSGTIDVHGNTVSLLSIGTGFKGDVTGRENLMLNGLLLGFSEKEIREKADSIIEFSELGKFIDMPVNTYSSGMRSKLAFSIAVNLETDIILVDEILSVGDSRFRVKSYQKMRELIKDENRTVMIVSHQENTLRTLCDRILWLDEGTLRMYDKADVVLDAYTEYMKG